MNSQEATIAVIDVLERHTVPYMLSGSFASFFYGISRLTKDADFVVELGDHSIARIIAELGPAFALDPQMSFETVTMTTRHIISVAEIEFKIELFHITDDPHDRERFQRRFREMYLDRLVWLPTVEDVVVTKLRWTIIGRRPKDRNDVRELAAVQGARIDWPYVHHWCDQHGTRALLDEIRQSIPPI